MIEPDPLLDKLVDLIDGFVLSDLLLKLLLAFLAGLPLLPALLGLEKVEFGKIFIILLLHFEGVAVKNVIESKIFFPEVDWTNALIFK